MNEREINMLYFYEIKRNRVNVRREVKVQA